MNSLKKETPVGTEVANTKYILGSGMKQEYIRNCMAGWVEEHKQLDGWIKLTENVLAKEPNCLSKFGIDLYTYMIEKAKQEKAKCRRKIKWLGQLHDKATGKNQFTPQSPYQQNGMDKEAIRERVDLVDFISGYTELKHCGRNYRGLCPLHKEKTPSFYVDPAKGWYCHGCNRGGDIYKFVMEAENVNFPTALARVGGMT